MEELVSLIALIIVVVAGAYALGAIGVALFAAGYLLSIRMLATTTVVIYAFLGVWFFRAYNGGYYRGHRRHMMSNWRFGFTMISIAVAFVWIVAAFQTEPVQQWWETASNWMLR